MATRGTIAVQLADGTIREVYCHWDSYLEHNGQILRRWYNSQALAELVTSQGDISSLDRAYEPTEAHSFNAPQDGVTTLYGRDRGDADAKPRLHPDFETYQTQGCGQEFNYLYINGRWTYSEERDPRNWQYLEAALNEMA